ncbi:MAG: hypothetical protein ACF8PN_01020 [Phycisphaerales bacterium]
MRRPCARWSGVLGFVGALFALSSTALAQYPPGQPAIPRTAEFETISSLSHVEPGRRFHLAFVFEIGERWRLDWPRHSDTLGEPSVRVQAPEGFVVNSTLYPGPERWTSESGHKLVGYRDEVILFSEIIPPDELEPGASVIFRVDASWWARPVDGGLTPPVREERTGELTLMVEDDETEAHLQNLDRIAPFLARLPREWDEVSGVHTEWWGTSLRPRLVVTVENAEEADFFAYPSRTTSLVSRELESDGDASILQLEFGYVPHGLFQRPEAHGLLMIRRGRSVAYFELLDSFRHEIAPRPTPEGPGAEPNGSKTTGVCSPDVTRLSVRTTIQQGD